jgi:hypothetical protein
VVSPREPELSRFWRSQSPVKGALIRPRLTAQPARPPVHAPLPFLRAGADSGPGTHGLWPGPAHLTAIGYGPFFFLIFLAPSILSPHSSSTRRQSQIRKRQISRRPLPTCRLHAAAAAAPISGSGDRRPPSSPRARAAPSRPASCTQRGQGQSRHPQSPTADGPTATCQALPPPPSPGSSTVNRRPAVRPGPGRAACGPTP